MIDEQLWAEIQRLHHVEHLNKSDIARRLMLDRGTVSTALASEVAPKYRRAPRGSIVALHRAAIVARLRDFPDISAARLLVELKSQGYRGGYSVLKEALRELRPREVEAFLRRETEPGQEAQVDWGSFGTLTIDGARRPLSCFVMVLGYSRMLHLVFTVSQRMEDFLRGHVEAFDFLGGVPHRILYDNLRSVVLARSGSTVRFHPRFLEFAGVHRFEPRPCGVRRANEKGKVEAAIKYIRTSFFAGQTFRDLYDLNAKARRWRDEVANVRLHATTRERPTERWPRERTSLLPLPAKPYDSDLVLPVQASSQCLVRFDANAYSVPFGVASKALLLRVSSARVAIFDKDKLVAEHRRCYGRHQVLELPEHVRGLVERKRAGRAVKARDVLIALCAEGKPYLDGLLSTGRRLDWHLVRIAALAGEYGPGAAGAAIAEAHRRELFGAGYIEQLLRSDGKAAPRVPVHLPHRPEVDAAIVVPHSLEVYERDEANPAKQNPPS